MSNFKESDHPRDSDGKFTQKGVSGYTDKVRQKDRLAAQCRRFDKRYCTATDTKNVGCGAEQGVAKRVATKENVSRRKDRERTYRLRQG